MIFAKLLEIDDPEWLFRWKEYVGDRAKVLAKLIEIDDPEWLCC